ncbi:MAG: hypothetical protein RR140_02390 [Clostridia bacterium]
MFKKRGVAISGAIIVLVVNFIIFSFSIAGLIMGGVLVLAPQDVSIFIFTETQKSIPFLANLSIAYITLIVSGILLLISILCIIFSSRILNYANFNPVTYKKKTKKIIFFINVFFLELFLFMLIAIWGWKDKLTGLSALILASFMLIAFVLIVVDLATTKKAVKAFLTRVEKSAQVTPTQKNNISISRANVTKKYTPQQVESSNIKANTNASALQSSQKTTDSKERLIAEICKINVLRDAGKITPTEYTQVRAMLIKKYGEKK